jgi:uncharacterized protein
MNKTTLENIVKMSLMTADTNVTFAFQGGEPTLCGLDFYRDLITLCSVYNEKKLKINYTIQTNGLKIAEDKNWAEFFADNKFLVGLSVDGTKALHNANRIDAAGNPTFDRTLQAASALKKSGVEFNILTVVNDDIARNITKIYNFYKSQGWYFMQFIPCLKPLGSESAQPLSSPKYGQFLKTLFDLWYADILLQRVSIRQFDNFLAMAMGYEPGQCGMVGVCTVQFVIESDGSVYPCDFYALDDYLIGNINTDKLKDIFESEKAQNFIKSSAVHNEKCKKCKWYFMCRGGCKRYKDADNLYIYCDALYDFFEYSLQKFKRLTSQIYNKR